jgi:3-deoxy-D-manno-octulosonic-acid transferase
MGPHTFNFDQAAHLAQAAGAARRVPDMADAVAQVAALLQDRAQHGAMVQAARAFAVSQRGAAGRMADALARLLAV